MKPTKIVVRQWCLALVSTASLVAGVISLQSCGGSGGPIGNNGGGGGGGGNAGIAAEFKALQPPAQQNATYVGSAKCGTCHGSTAPASMGKLASNTTTRGFSAGDVYDHWIATRHATEGVGCEQCHGPGSAHAAAPATDNILTFPNSTNPIVCAQCHGPIYDDWKASKHSQVVPDPVVASANLPTATGAQCFMCHSGLVRTKVEEGNVVIANLTADQAKELSEQTYNEADPASSAVPFTASCVTCHNPHSKTGNMDTDGEEVQLRHKLNNQDVSQIAPGTLPSQFIYFDQQCAECHNGRGANGSDAKLQVATTRPNMHDSPQYNMLMGIGGAEDAAGPVIRNMQHATIDTQCSHCHMPNARHTFTVSFDISCQPCHTADDAAARVKSAKDEIVPAEEALETRMASWAQATFGDSTLWDYTALLPEGHTAPDQSLIPIEIKRARHNYYFVIRDGCFGPHNAPYAKYLIKVANDNLDALGVSPAPATVTTNQTVNAMLQHLQQKADAAKLADQAVSG